MRAAETGHALHALETALYTILHILLLSHYISLIFLCVLRSIAHFALFYCAFYTALLYF